ncbi:MAG TPA: hypothetical protein VE132_03900, partial [Micromonosporaceae bacterium]|nr:hypothetical protein [Micromonosporaceae bacterium]
MDLRRLISLYGGVMIVISFVYFLGQPVRSIALGALAIVSTGAIVIGVRRHRPAAARWWLVLAVALVFDAAGVILYSALPSPDGQLKPWNWTVWILQGGMFVLLVAAMVGLARSTFRGVSAAIDGAIIVLGAGLIGAIAIALPYANATTGVVGTVRVLYVLRDVLIFAIVVHLATALRWTWSVAALLGGLLAFVTFDSLSRLARAHGERLSGTALDVGLIAFFVLIGAAALLPSMRRLDTPLSRDGRDASPARLGLVVILALLPSVAHLRTLFREPSPYEAMIFVAATLVLILALARIVDIGWQLRRQVYGERVVRETVTELADAQTASEIPPILERAVGRLFPPSVRHTLVIHSGTVAEWPGEVPPASGAALVYDAAGGADVVGGRGGGAGVDVAGVGGRPGGADVDVASGRGDDPAVLVIPLLRDKALVDAR